VLEVQRSAAAPLSMREHVGGRAAVFARQTSERRQALLDVLEPPGLGLERGLGDDLVIAPYATALAAMVDSPAAARNFAELARAGGLGPYGFYEALDYTRSRLPEGARVAVVKSYMAHH